jgi:ribonuclease HI
MPLTLSTLWIFTDGASRANGKPNCVASYGFYISDGTYAVRAHGQVAPVDIIGKKYKSSNNRGELLAIKLSLEYVYNLLAKPLTNNNNYNNIITTNATIENMLEFETITLVSDSEYSLNSACVWNCDKLKLNSDIIMPIKALIAAITKTHPLTFIHVGSHCSESVVGPDDAEPWFIWKGNCIADSLCDIPLAQYDARAAMASTKTSKVAKVVKPNTKPFVITPMTSDSKALRVTNTDNVSKKGKSSRAIVGFDES